MDKLTPLTPDKIADIAALANVIQRLGFRALDPLDWLKITTALTELLAENTMLRKRCEVFNHKYDQAIAEREGLIALPIALSNWRDNLRTTLGSPIMGDYLHGPALEFVIEQIDGLLARTALKEPTP